MLQEWTTPVVTEIEVSRAERNRLFACARNAKWRVSPQGQAWGKKHEATPERKVQKAKVASTFRSQHPDRVRKSSRDSQIKTPLKRMLRTAKTRAKRQGRPFSITVADFKFIPEFCPVLGLKLKYFGESISGAPDTASIDCLVPEKGYASGNVNIISSRANTIKNDGTADEHEAVAAWMKRVAS